MPPTVGDVLVPVLLLTFFSSASWQRVISGTETDVTFEIGSLGQNNGLKDECVMGITFSDGLSMVSSPP